MNRQVRLATMSWRKPSSAVIEPYDTDDADGEYLCTKVLTVGLPSLQQKETHKDVDINHNLDPKQQEEVRQLLEQYSEVLSDVPGSTTLAEHEVKLTSDTPVRLRPYPVPHALKESIRQEIESMIKLGIIEPTESNYSSPIVIVKKPDGTNRF